MVFGRVTWMLRAGMGAQVRAGMGAQVRGAALLSLLVSLTADISVVGAMIFTSVRSVQQLFKEEFCKAGEMAVLRCSGRRGNGKPTWTSYTSQELNLTSMSPAELRQMGVLLHERSLVILRASVKHQGNYSCSLGNGRSCWFSLTVYTRLSREIEASIHYEKSCYTQGSCTIRCPDDNNISLKEMNIAAGSTIWRKAGDSSPDVPNYFSAVKETDGGAYTCISSYLYDGQMYNMSFIVLLAVLPKKGPKYSAITYPRGNVTLVELGLPAAIRCEAVIDNDADSLLWLAGNSIVEKNDSHSVYCNSTWEKKAEGSKSVVFLNFRKVSVEDLSKTYTCELQSVYQPRTNVTITLALKGTETRPCYISFISIVGIPVVVVVIVVIYKKFKIDITLFLRDTLGCHQRTSDGKSYDAFLLSYKSNTVTALNTHDRESLENTLEEKFGYNLCRYDRDVLPGEAVANAVLDCVEQSRTVVLLPTSLDSGLESSLLSAVHAALVERQTRLVFVQAKSAEVSKSGSLPEALQLLGEAGHCITWEGSCSMQPSSCFWKHLRYHLPARSCRVDQNGRYQLLTIQDFNHETHQIY